MNNHRYHHVSAIGLVALALAGTALFFFSGCRSQKATLHIYTWSDYFKPELISRFERENRCQVVIDTFDSNEAMYAKLKAGATGYDLLTPTTYMVSVLFAQDMLQKIDHRLVPNLAHVDPDYLRIAVDKNMDHSVPYMLGSSGIAYLKSKVKDFRPSWTMFDRSDLKGRMTMFNDMRETIGAALKTLGYSLNSTNEKELQAARDVVLRWKKNLAKFENEQYKSGIASGEFLLVHGYSGDIMQVQAENPDIEYVIPQEGAAISCDDLVIPVQAKQVKLAHTFINFIHDPKVAAENIEFISWLCPNRDAYPLLSLETRQNKTLFPPTEVQAKCETMIDLGPGNALYVKIWDEIKAAE